MNVFGKFCWGIFKCTLKNNNQKRLVKKNQINLLIELLNKPYVDQSINQSINQSNLLLLDRSFGTCLIGISKSLSVHASMSSGTR